MVMSDMIHLFNVGQIEQSGTPVEIYTHPRTKFAANFIGNYNILDAAQFEVLTGEKAQTENVAIRPEVISLSVNPVEQPDSYLRKGKIINSVPHGNVIRYSIACDDVTLRVDVLFSDAMLLAEQSEVYCSIAKDNCLMLE